jgi:putative sigma-54 modulation protein
MKVHTEAVRFKADAALIDYVEKKVGKLDHFFDRIMEAQVYLKLENSGQVRDKISEVILKVPGETIVVKDSHKTFEASIDSACATLKRQLIKYKEKMRVKS